MKFIKWPPLSDVKSLKISSSNIDVLHKQDINGKHNTYSYRQFHDPRLKGQAVAPTLHIQVDSLARGPKHIWEKHSRIWRNAFKCPWM